MSRHRITTNATVNIDLQELRLLRELVALEGIRRAATAKPLELVDRLQAKLKHAAHGATVEPEQRAVVRTFVLTHAGLVPA